MKGRPQPPTHGWTGRGLPWTSGNKEIHEEIASSQVEHWSKEQIKAAQKNGYFDSLTKRCQVNAYYRLLQELSGDEEEE